MKKIQRHSILMTSLALCLGSAMSWAQPVGSALNLTIVPQLFDSELLSSESDQVTRARLHSGLGLSLDSRLFDFELDYRLQGEVKEGAVKPGYALPQQAPAVNSLSQQFNARLQSTLLNDLFGVDAGVRANTVLLEGGDGYRHKLTPGIARSLSRLARLSVNYDYVLDKPSAQAVEKEGRAYSMVLDGTAQGGRLVWSSSYRNSSEFKDRLVLTRAIEALDLKSRYQLASSMHVELSSALRSETKYAGSTPALLREKRYGAAIAWSPSRQYSLAFKMNTREQEGEARRDTFGSGTVSWTPRPDLQFTLDYGDKTADGAPGWMLHTRFDISG